MMLSESGEYSVSLTFGAGAGEEEEGLVAILSCHFLERPPSE
jgi:hypothetical protein